LSFPGQYIGGGAFAVIRSGTMLFKLLPVLYGKRKAPVAASLSDTKQLKSAQFKTGGPDAKKPAIG